MKVKKKHIFLIGSVIFAILIICFLVLLALISRYNISANDAEGFVRSGFLQNMAEKEDIIKYNSENQNAIDILHYGIYIELIPKKELIDSKVVIKGVKNLDRLDEIILNFNDGFKISYVLLNEKEIKYKYNQDKIIIPFYSDIEDTFKVEIKYKGSPESLGFGSFTFGENNDLPVVYSLNEPIFASTWFPCNDTPSDKSLSDVYITNDSSMVSVSNGLLIGTKINGNKKTYHWKTNYPISTYLISLYSAKYKSFNEGICKMKRIKSILKTYNKITCRSKTTIYASN